MFVGRDTFKNEETGKMAQAKQNARNWLFRMRLLYQAWGEGQRAFADGIIREASMTIFILVGGAWTFSATYASESAVLVAMEAARTRGETAKRFAARSF